MDRKHNFEFVSRVLSTIVLHAPKNDIEVFSLKFSIYGNIEFALERN